MSADDFDDSAELASALLEIAKNPNLSGEESYFLREAATQIICMHRDLRARHAPIKEKNQKQAH